MERSIRKRLQLEAERGQAAHDVSGDFYTATLHAPPDPHLVVGLAVGQPKASAMEAVVSMQAYARALGADGVLGVSICTETRSMGSDAGYVAYGTAVQWAPSE
ncbi:heavy metal-binding domain-containing protein [Streptomyces sp. NPDC001553]|uniref:heavy metal-binding domain-containing protein n=1 Tax=Streptomyces sp. NPDC001553 TaxID=3154385 RepID=UPI0033269C8C